MDSFFIFGAEYLFVISVLVFIWLSFIIPRESKKKFLLATVLTFFFSLAIAFIAGALYFNPQPFVVGGFEPLVLQSPLENGFPSHHTLLVTAIAAVAWYYHRRIGLLLWVITFLVAFSRVYVGVHHLVDVFASVVIALVVAYVVERILILTRRTQPK